MFFLLLFFFPLISALPTPQQLEWNGIFLPDLSCNIHACCCFTTAFQLSVKMNELGEKRIYIQGGNMTGTINGSPCDFINFPLVFPTVDTPHVIAQQTMGGGVLTNWYLNDNATMLMVINGLENANHGSTCSFQAVRQPDDIPLSTPAAIDFTMFPHFPCGYEPCPALEPVVTQWIGTYSPSNDILCASSCNCYQHDIAMTLNIAIDGSYHMILGGSYYNGSEWIYEQDEMMLPNNSYTPSIEWNNNNYIFSLTINKTWITLLAINQNTTTCSFSLVRLKPAEFVYVTKEVDSVTEQQSEQSETTTTTTTIITTIITTTTTTTHPNPQQHRYAPLGKSTSPSLSMTSTSSISHPNMMVILLSIWILCLNILT